MSSPVPSQSGRQRVAATAVIFVALASFVGAVVVGSSLVPAKPVTGTNVNNPFTNLEFSMSLNSTSVQRGSVLAASLNLYNTLDRANNVTGAAGWQLTDASENGGPYGWNCGTNDVFRIEVVQGYYDLSNFSKATPLDVMAWELPLGPNQCGFYVRGANWTAPVLSVPPQNQNFYIFRPMSNGAWWVTSGELHAACLPSNGTYHPCNPPGQEAVLNESMILNSAKFTNSTGIFTVIGGDEWGDLGALHFYVGPPATRTTS